MTRSDKFALTGLGFWIAGSLIGIGGLLDDTARAITICSLIGFATVLWLYGGGVASEERRRDRA